MTQSRLKSETFALPTLYCRATETLERIYELVCEQDLEGIICKPKTSPYPFTWIKVKNPNYSQAIGPREMFNRPLPQR